MESNEILIGLNPQQKSAVEQMDGPVLIVAGAGSGKTRVLTSRIAYAISKGKDPSRMMALTFTKKAAGEMKERIAAMVGARAARKLYMGTFHAVFVRFLRDYADYLGYPSTFTIYDTSDSISLIKTCLKKLGLDEKVYKPKDILSRISDAKSSLVSPAKYHTDPRAHEEDVRAKKPRFADVYNEYWKHCRQSGVMDFDDILYNMNYLMATNNDARQEIASRFDYLLVDEYQDTNYSQYRILKSLCVNHCNICVVGDDSQSIYAFRGARVENILRFEKEFPNTRVFRLEQNYRSTRTIVDAANSVIEKNKSRIKKNCFSQADQGELIKILRAFTDQEEAFMVGSAIVDRIRSDRAEYKDFAVLYRTNNQSRLLEEQLRKRNIPYVIYSGNSFFERAEVKDVMAYLKLVVNLDDDESFKRIVNKPARGIGNTSLMALQAAAMHKKISFFKAATSPEELSAFGLKAAAYTRIEQFCRLVKEAHDMYRAMDAHEFAVKWVKESGIWMHYAADTSVEGKARTANVQELLDSIKSFVEERHSEYFAELQDEDSQLEYDAQSLPLVTLDEFLENVSLLSAVDVSEEEDANNKVVLMTAHASKGLEFPYVFVTGLEENLFPSGSMMMTSQDVEEERRLFYVAITRAEKALTLSFAQSRMRNGQHESNPPSRFIREIDDCYYVNPLPSVKTNFVGSQGEFRPAARSQTSLPSRPSVPTRPVSHISANSRPTKDIIPSPILEIKEGCRVEHGKWGYGTVVSLTKDGVYLKAQVKFDEVGDKVLILQYAKLRVLK